MNDEAIRKLRCFPVKEFKKGETMIRQGEEACCIYYLEKGKARRNAYTVRGDELVYDERVADNSSSCLLGALSSYYPTRVHSTNFVAETNCVCRKVPVGDFRLFLHENPDIMDDLLYIAMQSYAMVDGNFRGKMRGLAPSRVATYLLQRVTKNDGVYVYRTRLNASAISRDLGIHRLTVGKIIRALADEGIIVYQGDSFVVKLVERLRNVADGMEAIDYKDR